MTTVDVEKLCAALSLDDPKELAAVLDDGLQWPSPLLVKGRDQVRYGAWLRATSPPRSSGLHQTRETADSHVRNNVEVRRDRVHGENPHPEAILHWKSPRPEAALHANEVEISGVDNSSMHVPSHHNVVGGNKGEAVSHSSARQGCEEFSGADGVTKEVIGDVGVNLGQCVNFPIVGKGNVGSYSLVGAVMEDHFVSKSSKVGIHMAGLMEKTEDGTIITRPRSCWKRRVREKMIMGGFGGHGAVW
ncbi:hypothetical protein ACOSP7_010032 [Xanthoceras sorbifolium]